MLVKLEALNIPSIMVKSIQDTDDEIIALQRGQLSLGLMSTGQYLPHYSWRSIEWYGKPDTPIKLYDTGAFYAGIRVDVRQDIFIINSVDSKNTMLKNRYTEDIFGLADAALKQYLQSLRPVFINSITRGLL